MIGKAKFTYSSFGKAVEKQRKTIEDQQTKQVLRKDLKYKTEKYIYMIFNDLKQKNRLVIVFILVKLMQMKLRMIKAIY